jgi:hypothetical protein
MPSRYDIIAEQGADLNIHFTYRTGNTGINLSGYTASLQVRPSKFSEKVFLSVINENLYSAIGQNGFNPSQGQTGELQIGGIYLNVSENGYPGYTGGIYFRIGSEATRRIPSGKSFYDLELTTNQNEVFKLLEGSFDCKPEITRVTSTVSGLVNFSENLSNIIEYESVNKKFTISGLTFSSNTFIKTPKYQFDLLDIQKTSNKNIDFSFNQNLHEAKISNDGKELLLFSKINDKIYHIGLTGSYPGTAELKYTISEDLPGNPEDKIWAVDDEVSSMTVSSKALERSASIYDTKLTTHNISSKIKYYRRSINGLNKYKWKRIHENHAAGFVNSYKKESSLTDFLDSLNFAPGIYRTNDIKTKNKNYALSTISLINDQKEYNSKITGFYSPRYVSGQLNRDVGITYFAYSSYNSGQVTGATFEIFNFPFGVDQEDDTATGRKYKCSPSLKLFRIHKKINDYYHVDNSFRDSHGLNYYYPLNNNNQSYSTINYLVQGITIPSSITDLMKLFPSINLLAIGHPTTVPQVEQQLRYSQTSLSDNFVCYSMLYDFISSSETIKRLVVLKFPINAQNNLNLFKDYEASNASSGLVPNSGSGYGLISSFYGVTGSEVIGAFKTLSPLSYEIFTTNADNLISNQNLNTITTYSFNTSNSRYFITFNDKVLIWTYSSGTYTIINQPDTNFIQSKFYYTNDGEFFINGNNIWKYDSAQTLFTKIEITQ